MKKSKVLLLFPDGVGIRNYLYSEVFKGIDDCILFHNFDIETINYLKKNSNLSGDFVIPVYKESIVEKFLRELISLSRLKHNSKITSNNTILNNWKKNHKSIKKKVFYFLIEFVSFLIKEYKIILFLENRYQKEIRKTKFYRKIKEILLEINPKSIFCSHQRAINAATIFAVANDLKIPTNTVIYSWDNLPKARLALKSDKYLVWSEYMKNEMNFYYPEISNDQIEVTGTPQFEFYGVIKNIINKDIFYKKYNLDFNKKIICYSGDDILTSPNDQDYLRDLVEELIKHNMDDKYQILLRKCPVDLSNRFASVISEYPHIIKEVQPSWVFNTSNSWSNIYPLKDDIELLVSTVYYSDFVINIGSTMAFDFSMYGKPCIFINYNHELKERSSLNIEEVYKFEHFKSMPNFNAVIWLNSKTEIVNIIEDININNLNLSIDLWKEKVLGNYADASLNIRKVLKLQF